MNVCMKNYVMCLWGVLVLMCALASCSEDTDLSADPYQNWEARNSAYLDSIANVVENPPAGERWTRYANYKIQSGGGLEGTTILPVSDYVYVKDLTEAERI